MAQAPPVNFLIVGVQKGGTTALFDYLSGDATIALSRVKETHFFDDDARDWAQADYRDYHTLFEAPAGRPCGEATPIYLYWPNCLERIRAYNPAMKLVVLLRDPVERAWSHWKMEYARGVETQPFAWCVRQGRQRLFQNPVWGHDRELSYVERGFYAEQLQRLFSLFPRDQVLMRSSKDLRADPVSTVAAVRAFIGAPPAHGAEPRDVHVGREMDYGSQLTSADIAYLREIYARDDARLADLTGFRFG